MPKCKDCVHWEACREYVTRLTAARGVDLDATELEQIFDSDDCDHFHDSSRFVELPIKPGEKIFYYDTAGHIYESTVTQLVYGATGFLIDSDVMFDSNLIGERFFLTQEAAEQALKKRENNG